MAGRGATRARRRWCATSGVDHPVSGRDKDEIVILFKKELADPGSFLEHYFTGKDGMFSAKDGKKFIEQLHIGMSHNSRIWASKAYR